MDNNFSLNLSNLPKELRLLLKILETENDVKNEIIKNEMHTDIDWELFLQLSRHHRVYPLIYSKLKSLDIKGIPQHVIQTLHQEFKKNTFQMLLLTGEIEQVSKLFTENQIRLLFLKGPVIAADIYGDISLRTSKDLDILIPITDLEKAEKLLFSLGYEKEKVPTVLNDWKWKYHHIVYFHTQKKVQLEIHWRLQPRPNKEPSFNKLWERKRVSNITSYPVYYLGKEDLFLYLVSHGARHGWFRLRWLLDIDQMLRKGIDFDKTNLLMEKYQCFYSEGQALILASQILKTPIEEENKILTVENRSKELAKMAMFFIIKKMPLDIIMSTNYYRRYQLLLKTSKLQKIYPFILLFYPNYADVQTFKLPKLIHFLYFPLRPFLWAWRKTKKFT